MNGPLQWTPSGMVPALNGPVANASSRAILPPAVSTAAPDDDDEDAPLIAVVRPARRPAPKGATPKDVVRMARARLRELETELKRLRRLEKERDELRRLVEAAKAKPRAVLRELPKRSAG